jgi:hypothetical protein
MCRVAADNMPAIRHIPEERYYPAFDLSSSSRRFFDFILDNSLDPFPP